MEEIIISNKQFRIIVITLVLSFFFLPFVEDVSGKTVPLYLGNPYEEWNNKKVTYHIDLAPGVYGISVTSEGFDPDLWVKVATDSSFNSIIHESDNPGYNVDENFNIAVYENQTIYIKVGAVNDEGLHEITVSRVHSTPNLTIMPYPDQTIKNTTSGNNIIWFILDSTINNTYYEIYRNETLIEQGNWVTSSMINISIDGLKIGTYNYTIIAYDGLGEYKTDLVVIEVIDGWTNFYNISIILLVLSLLFLGVEFWRSDLFKDLGIYEEIEGSIGIVIAAFFFLFFGRFIILMFSGFEDDLGTNLEGFIRSILEELPIQIIQLIASTLIIVSAILVSMTWIIRELKDYVQKNEMDTMILGFRSFIFLSLTLLCLIILLEIDTDILVEDLIHLVIFFDINVSNNFHDLSIILLLSSLLLLIVKFRRTRFSIDLAFLSDNMWILYIWTTIVFTIILRVVSLIVFQEDVGPHIEGFIQSIVDVFLIPFIQVVFPSLLIIIAILISLNRVITELKNCEHDLSTQIKNLVFNMSVFSFLALLWLIIVLRIDSEILLEDFFQLIEVFAPLIIIIVFLLIIGFIIFRLKRINQRKILNKQKQIKNREILDKIHFFVKTQSAILDSHELVINNKLILNGIDNLITELKSLKSKIPVLPYRNNIPKSDISSYDSLSDGLVKINNKCVNLLEKLYLKKQDLIHSHLKDVEKDLDDKISHLKKYETSLKGRNVNNMLLTDLDLLSLNIKIMSKEKHLFLISEAATLNLSCINFSTVNVELFKLIKEKQESLIEECNSLSKVIESIEKLIKEKTEQKEFERVIKANIEELKEIQTFISDNIQNLEDLKRKTDIISNREQLMEIKENVTEIKQILPYIPPSFVVLKEDEIKLAETIQKINYLRSICEQILEQDIPWKELILTKLTKFIRLIKRTKSIRLDYMADFLGYDVPTLLEFLTTFPDEYDIIIDGDNVSFGLPSNEDGMKDEMIKQFNVITPSQEGVFDAIIIDLKNKGQVDETEIHFIVNTLHKRLEKKLRAKITGLSPDTNQEYFEIIDQACNTNLITTTEKDILHSYRKLRNQFIHGKREIISAEQIIPAAGILKRLEEL